MTREETLQREITAYANELVDDYDWTLDRVHDLLSDQLNPKWAENPPGTGNKLRVPLGTSSVDTQCCEWDLRMACVSVPWIVRQRGWVILPTEALRAMATHVEQASSTPEPIPHTDAPVKDDTK